MGVTYVRAANAATRQEATHRFTAAAVMRQSLDNGELEFATMVPFHDADAKACLQLVMAAPTCNFELGGQNGVTTFSPSPTSVEHLKAMAALYERLAEQPSLISQLQERAIGFKEFAAAIQ